MENKKLIPISIGVLGLGVLLLALTKANSSKSKIYLDQNYTSGLVNAKQIAEELYKAMKEMNFTNTQKREVIFTSLTGVTPRDFQGIVKAFGFRYYNPITGNTYFAFWQTPQKHPLKTWLKEELSTSDYQLLKSKYPKQL